MEPTIIDFLTNQVGKNGVFFALLIIVGAYLKKEIEASKQDGKEREEKLQQQLEKTNDQLDRAIDALDKMTDKYDLVVSELRDLKDQLKK